MHDEHADRLVTALRRAAYELVTDHSVDDVEDVLEGIVIAAVQTVPGADAGGVTMAERGHVASRGPTEDTVRKLDAIQAQLNEGPCITAADDPAEDGVVLVGDLSGPHGSARWPRFAPQAVGLGFRSLMSAQLSVDGGTRAALNLYSHEPHVFDESARTVAGLFGVQAGLLLHGVHRTAQLSIALGTRDVIGQAKGILMERFSVRDDQAFQMLVRSSQDTNVKLADVARWLTTERNSNARPEPDTS